MMKKIFLQVILCTTTQLLIGQNIDRFVIASSGVLSVSNGLTLSTTVGESVIGTSVGEGLTLSQGFQWIAFEETEETLGLPSQSLVFYPNPTTDILQVEFESEKRIASQIWISSLKGERLSHLILNKTNNPLIVEIDLRPLSNGIYLLGLEDPETGIVRTFKVFKTN